MLPRASWLTPATLQCKVPLFSLEREARVKEHPVPPIRAGCPTHPQHRQRPATPHTACGVSQLLPPFEPHPQRLLPQQQDDSAGGKILQPTLVNVGWSGDEVGGKGKGGTPLPQRKRRVNKMHIYKYLCTALYKYIELCSACYIQREHVS